MKKIKAVLLAGCMLLSVISINCFIQANEKKAYPAGTVADYNKAMALKANTLMVDSTLLQDYRIITPRAASYLYISELQNLQSTLSENYGYNIEILDDRQTEASYEILVGETNRSLSETLGDTNAFRIFVNNNKLVINAGSNQALGYAVRYFSSQIGNTVFGADYNYYGTAVFGENDYSRVWGDEFNAAELDSEKWRNSTQIQASKQGGQVRYTKSNDNTYLSDGTLKQASLRVPNTNNSYTCSYIDTSKSMTFVYGIAEIRAKLPVGNGIWPAFWCNNQNNRTAFQEIDIFEMFPGNTKYLEFALHRWWVEYDAITLQRSMQHNTPAYKGIVRFTDENIGDDWHNIGMVWTKESIKITFDGYVKCEYNITGEDSSFFHSPVHFILNNACGLGGIPDETTPFPNIMQTDYINLYQTGAEGKIYYQ